MILTPMQPLDLTIRADQYSERSDGLHLSRVTHDILCGLDPERYDDREGGPNWMNFIMGLVFERVLEMAWLDRESQVRPELIRPGEVHLDGIIGTPDAYDTLLGRPEEAKCTKKSCRQPITDNKFWHYWVQLKAYCKMLGCTEGVLWVLFINGNYNRTEKLADGSHDPESGYIIKGWEAKWTQLEIDENWAMLWRHAQRRGWIK